MGRLLDDPSLYDGLVGTVEETQATVRAVRKSAEQIEHVVDRLGGLEGARLLADAAEAAVPGAGGEAAPSGSKAPEAAVPGAGGEAARSGGPEAAPPGAG